MTEGLLYLATPFPSGFPNIRSGYLDFAGMLSYLLKVYTSVSVRETTVIRNACTMTAVCFIEITLKSNRSGME